MIELGSHELLLVALAAIAAGGLLYVFAYPLLSGEAKAEKRKVAFLSPGTARKIIERQVDANARRKQITDSLKEIETRNKRKKLSLEGKLVQAGLDWSRNTFIAYSCIAGLVLGVLLFLIDKNIILALGGALIGGLGLPRWYVQFKAKRRVKKFVENFPEAIDIIVRGIKAGLPLGDCLQIIASEAQEPIKTEFRMIVEAQSMGLSVAEAVERLIARLPIAETSFFSIVISIQQKAGGNLSEALSNLADVLRDRKKMKGKIAALSSEAKASAGIIGALPFVVTALVYLTSPSYISLLWTSSTGELVMIGSAIWMAAGVFVMKQMISFEI
ncbi:MAG: type II secretion system F family protein [Beijerinckiaceae bacterium]|nr:MAG: type II secretion system F family protein [Beijerinckiaceae bacterium]